LLASAKNANLGLVNHQLRSGRADGVGDGLEIVDTAGSGNRARKEIRRGYAIADFVDHTDGPAAIIGRIT
jgi:hypothetical protein